MSTLRISDAPLLPDVDGTEKIPTGGRGDYAISVDQIKDHIFQDVGKELVGLGNVDNTSDLDKPVSTAQQAALNLKADKTYVDNNLDLKADKTNVYTRSETTLALSTKADLVNGTIPENQIPSSFNDVLEFTTSTLPIVGESGKIYVTTDNNRTWRWGGNQYVEISNGGVSDSALKLQTARRIANIEFNGTQDIDIPHNNLTSRNTENAHTAASIGTASGENQQDINDYNGARWREKAGGYDLNARVMLDNGDIVKSTIVNNTANPNVDMTGWILVNNPDQIPYKFGSQLSFNERFLFPQDFGAEPSAKLSSKFSTLAAAKFAYANIADRIVNLDQSLFWAGLQSAVVSLGLKGGGEVVVTEGDWVLSDPIYMKDNVTIAGRGKASNIVAELNTRWSRRSLFYFQSVNDAWLKNLKIDQNGRNRLTEHVTGSSVIFNDVLGGGLYRVSITDAGGSTSRASTPQVYLMAKDVLDDLTDVTDAVVGGVDGVTIVGCSFSMPDNNYRCGFSIRLMTDFIKRREREDYVHHVQNCKILANSFNGDFYWNHVELAGAGTRFNQISFNRFTGEGFTAVDFDKGCNYNIAQSNTVNGWKFPASHNNDNTVRLAVFHDHGSAATYLNVGNKMLHNHCTNVVGRKTGNEALYLIQNVVSTLFDGNSADGLNDGELGAGIFIDSDSYGVNVSNSQIEGVQFGIQTNGNMSTGGRWDFSNNNLKSRGSAISLAAAAGSMLSDVTITGGVLESAEGNVIAIGSANRFSDVYIGNGIKLKGGLSSIRSGAAGLTVSGAVCQDGSGVSVELADGYATLSLITTKRMAGGDLIVSSGVPLPTLIGNTFAGSTYRNPIETYASAIPTSGTYLNGDKVWNTVSSAGGVLGWVCVTAGTAGTLSGRTANTTSGSNVIVMSSTSGIKVGDYLIIAGSGIFHRRVTAINGLNVTMTHSATETLVDAAVSFASPVFKGFGLIES